jgi:oligopeptide transport system permease protein
MVVIMLLILVLKPGLVSVLISLAMTGWIGMSRMTRAQIIKYKEEEFILAARTIGEGPFRIMFREILPNIAGQSIVIAMFSIPNAIFAEAYLSFIGIGIPVPLASLGSLISDAFKSFTIHPYMIIAPVLVLATLMLGFNLLADQLRDALDPKQKDA